MQSIFKIKNSLGPLEQEIMDIAWRGNKISVRDVVGRLSQSRPIAYTTVMTVMNNLYRKGFLLRKKIKKSYYYSPVMGKDDVVKISLSEVFRGLVSDYGKRKVLYHAFSTSISPKINIKPISSYQAPIGYGISLTLLLSLFGLSAYDLLQNLSFFGSFDYLNLLVVEPNFLSNKLHLFILAFLESLPIINILTTIISFTLIIILTRKLSKLFDFKTPIFTSFRGAI